MPAAKTLEFTVARSNSICLGGRICGDDSQFMFVSLEVHNFTPKHKVKLSSGGVKWGAVALLNRRKKEQKMLTLHAWGPTYDWRHTHSTCRREDYFSACAVCATLCTSGSFSKKTCVWRGLFFWKEKVFRDFSRKVQLLWLGFCATMASSLLVAQLMSGWVISSFFTLRANKTSEMSLSRCSIIISKFGSALTKLR